MQAPACLNQWVKMQDKRFPVDAPQGFKGSHRFFLYEDVYFRYRYGYIGYVVESDVNSGMWDCKEMMYCGKGFVMWCNRNV